MATPNLLTLIYALEIPSLLTAPLGLIQLQIPNGCDKRIYNEYNGRKWSSFEKDDNGENYISLLKKSYRTNEC